MGGRMSSIHAEMAMWRKHLKECRIESEGNE